MPRGLKSHSNERIDLDDFRSAAKEYTDDRIAFDAKSTVLSRRARFVEGFRIEVSDQGTNPGEISVFNGHVFDRSGILMTNEDQVNDSRTVTLVGANLYFYLELEYIEDDADPDARAFWDSVYDNPSPDPDGREFTLTVPTRLAPNWRIVTPVSTTGFDSTASANSTRIPLAILHTSAANVIDGPGGVPVQVVASTVLEQDTAPGAGTIRVINSRLFPDTGTMSIDFGGTLPEAVTISANDRENGILTFAPNLVSTRRAGAIVRVTGVTGRFILENTSPSSVALVGASSTTSDARRRVFQGDEYRGAAVAQSKETFGVRDDLNIESSKDYYDFMAAHLRDLRWGTMRPDDNSKVPPTTFASTRYYDHTGGIMGSRTMTVSVGDGTNSWGDINGTTDAVFTQAIAALPADGGTIFVKRGTYTFGTEVAITKPVRIIGEGRDTVDILKGNITYAFTVATGSTSRICEFLNLNITLAAAATADAVMNITQGTVLFDQCSFDGRVRAQTSSVRARNTTFSNSSALSLPTAAFDLASGVLSNSMFENCAFSCGSGNVSNTSVRMVGSSLGITWDTCTFGAPIGVDISGVCIYSRFLNCIISGTTTAFRATTSVTNSQFINTVLGTSGASNGAATFFATNFISSSIENCPFAVTITGATSIASPHRLVQLEGTINGSSVEGCTFSKSSAGVSYAEGLFLNNATCTDQFTTTDCSYLSLLRGIRVESLAANSSLDISSSLIDGKSVLDSRNGLYVNTLGANSRVSVSKLVVKNLNGNASAATGIEVITGGGFCEVSIDNCEVNNVDATASVATGILLNGSAIFNGWVRGCYVYDLESTGSFGIRVQGAAANNVHIVDNTCSLILSSASSCSGIDVEYCGNSTITGNTVTSMTALGGGFSALGVACSRADNTVIADNALSGSIYVLRGSYLTIKGNILNLPTQVTYGIAYLYNVVSSDQVVIEGNLIDGGSSLASSGIEITGGAALTLRGCVVSNNVVSLSSAAATVGIYHVEGLTQSLVVSNNAINENNGFHINHRGIYITTSTSFGHATLSVCGNTFTGATKTAGRLAAVMVRQFIGDVVGNTVDVGLGSFTGDGIYVEHCFGTVGNNLVNGVSTSSGLYIAGTAGATTCIVSGNAVSPASFTNPIRAVGSSTVNYAGNVSIAHTTLGSQAGIVVYGYNMG